MKEFSSWCVLKCWLPSHKLRPSRENVADFIFTSCEVVIRWPTIITWHEGLLFRVPTWVWLWVLKEARGEPFCLSFWAVRCTTSKPTPRLALLPKAHSIKSLHSRGLFRLSHRLIADQPLENWEIHLEVCAEKADRKVAGQLGNKPIGALWIEDWGALGDLHFLGCISVMWSLIMAIPGK